MKTLQQQLAKILEEYGDEIKDNIEEAVEITSKATRKELQRISPTNTGKYAKGWTVNKIEKTWKGIEVTVYNRTKPGLTHLLNNGHVKQNGGRQAGDGHIDKAETYADDLLIREEEGKLR